MLVTTVVSGSRETFGVLVSKHGAVRFHDSQRGQVLKGEISSDPILYLNEAYLGSDQFQTRELTPRLIFDDFGHIGISLSQGLVEDLVLKTRHDY